MRTYVATLLLSLLSAGIAAADELTFSANELIDASTGFVRNERPRLAFTEDGRSHIVWARGASFGTEGAFLVSATVEGTYGDATQVSAALDGILIDGGYGPTISTSGNYVAIGWEDRTESSAKWSALSTNMGSDWASPVRAQPLAVGLRDYQCVALFPDGGMSQTWAKFDANYTNPRYEWTRQRPDGTFEVPIVATGTAGTVCECCAAHQVVLDDGQTVLHAFRRNNANIRETHVVRSMDGGVTFTELHRVDTSEWFIPGCPASGPHIVADGDNVLVTFMTAGSGSPHIFATRSSDGGANWDAMIQIDQETTGANVNYSQVALRGDIGVVVYEGRDDTAFAIFAALSTDGGQTWGDPVVVSDVTGPLVKVPTVAISPSLEVEVAWRDKRDGEPHLYRARAFADVSSVSTSPQMVGVQLGRVYPNPGPGQVTVPFSLREAGRIRMTAHDLFGREVAEITSQEFKTGEHQISWATRDGEGFDLGPGVYWIRLEELSSGSVSSTSFRVVR